MEILKHISLAFILLLAGMIATAPSLAQDDADASRRSALGERLRLVERKMVDLENKLTVIADKLREKEPKRAELLVKAYQQSKEQLVTKKMAKVGQLLDSKKYEEADDLIDEVRDNIESLIRLLTQQKEKEASKEEEEKQLERWKKDIEKRLKEQREQRKETEKISKPNESAKKLEAQIKKLKGLIEDQKRVIKETEEKAGEGLRALDKVADKQFEVRKGN